MTSQNDPKFNKAAKKLSSGIITTLKDFGINDPGKIEIDKKDTLSIEEIEKLTKTSLISKINDKIHTHFLDYCKSIISPKKEKDYSKNKIAFNTGLVAVGMVGTILYSFTVQDMIKRYSELNPSYSPTFISNFTIHSDISNFISDYSINKGYTFVWDGDMSDKGFTRSEGIAVVEDETDYWNCRAV